MAIEMGKAYRTRDGREVRIYAMDGGGNFPVQGAIKTEGEWHLMCWTAAGKYNDKVDHSLDLVEVKPRIQRKVWVNVFSGYVVAYTRRQKADLDNACRLACVEIDIDVEEGHGL